MSTPRNPSTTPTFHAWVLKQTTRDDAVGDLARDYRTGVKRGIHGRASSPDGLIKILHAQRAIPAALEAASRLKEEWMREPKQAQGNPFSDPAAPLTVRVRLERWVGDYAQEIGSVDFDARAVFDSQHLDSIGTDQSDLDWVFYAAVANGLIENHDGPFTVEVPEDLAEYIEHRENAGMTEAYPSAAEALAATRVDHLQAKLQQTLAEAERLRAAIVEAENALSAAGRAAPPVIRAELEASAD
ncbi:hypothetical protein [Microbacterium aerolatum]|uniref:hypothetical protein n=1 Tax=Microbacterium aerolatum TaxID=153731 RepID=UPI00384E9436